MKLKERLVARRQRKAHKRRPSAAVAQATTRNGSGGPEPRNGLLLGAEALELGNLDVPLRDAAPRPGLRGLDQAAAELVQLVLAAG